MKYLWPAGSLSRLFMCRSVYQQKHVRSKCNSIYHTPVKWSHIPNTTTEPPRGTYTQQQLHYASAL